MAALLACQTALAGDVYWVGNTPYLTNTWASFNEPLNWNTGVKPGTGDYAVFYTGTPTYYQPRLMGSAANVYGVKMTGATACTIMNGSGAGAYYEVNIGAGGVTVDSGAGLLKFGNSFLYLTADQPWTVNNTAGFESFPPSQKTTGRNLIKDGTGTLTFTSSATNPNQGNYAVYNGALRLSGSHATNQVLWSGSTVTLGHDANSGKLILGVSATYTRNQNLAGLYTSGTGTENAVTSYSATGSIAVLTLNIASGVDTFSGRLGGSVSAERNMALTKDGNGTLTLTNAGNYYIGATTINAGTLLVDGAINGSAVTVNAGTLGGSGAIGGDVTVTAGTLSPGNGGAGSLELGGALSLAAGTALNIELGGTSFTLNGVEQYDRLVASGEVNLGGSTLNLLASTYDIDLSFGPNDVFGIIDAGSVVGTLANFAEGDVVYQDGRGGKLKITYAGNIEGNTVSATGGHDVVLYITAVPEPSTAAALLAALFFGACILADAGYDSRKRLSRGRGPAHFPGPGPPRWPIVQKNGPTA